MEQISTETRKMKSEDNEAKRLFSLLTFTFMFAFYFSWQHKTLYLHIKPASAIRLNISRLSTGNKINLPLVFNLKETKSTRYYDQKSASSRRPPLLGAWHAVCTAMAFVCSWLPISRLLKRTSPS